MKVLNSPPIAISAGAILTLAGFVAADVGNGGFPDEKQFVNTVGIRLVRIERGSFVMGNDKELPAHLAAPNADLRFGDYDESPVHRVTITRAFYMSETEVTVEQYRKFKSDYPGFSDKLDNDP
jgi:formylglycine-generating enzyme required for sulfatase activity